MPGKITSENSSVGHSSTCRSKLGSGAMRATLSITE
uniref:Uncharacterized protein n=1 Tax=Anguilla anguilla TaxID=7936 RepID=A0A0E9PBZ7_ANGAN